MTAIETWSAVPAPRVRRSSYLFLIAIVSVLCIAGLVMVLSASSVDSLRSFGTPWSYFERQAAYLCMGAIAFFVAQGTRITLWQKLARPLMFLAGAALLAVLVVGRSAGGASRWLGTGSLQFQPSELAKLALVLFAADVLARREGKRDWVYRAAPVVIAMGIFAILIMKQPDMGTAVVLCCAGAAVLFVAGMPVFPMLGLAGVAILGGAVLAVSASYRAARVDVVPQPVRPRRHHRLPIGAGPHSSWRGPLDRYGTGTEPGQLGLPSQPLHRLYICSYRPGDGLCWQLAHIEPVRGDRRCGHSGGLASPDHVRKPDRGGITAWLLSQAIINTGAVANLLPVTGVPLPFVSYGGTSLVIVLFATGLLANVARRCGPSTANGAPGSRRRAAVPGGTAPPSRPVARQVAARAR